MFIVDTDVVSNLRKKKSHPTLVSWMDEVGWQELAMTVLTVMEIQIGIERARRSDAATAGSVQIKAFSSFPRYPGLRNWQSAAAAGSNAEISKSISALNPGDAQGVDTYCPDYRPAATSGRFVVANRPHQLLISWRTFVPDPLRDSH